MSPKMTHVRWRVRLSWLLTTTTILSTCLAAPQQPHPQDNYRIAVSREDTGEVSHESLHHFSQSTQSGGHGASRPLEMTKAWMNFGDADSSHVGKPVSNQYFLRRDSHESVSREQSDYRHHHKSVASTGSRGRHYSMIHDDDDDGHYSAEHDNPHSAELYSNEYDDDLKIMSKSLGRRYHPVGIPLPKTPAFVPPPASPAAAKSSVFPPITAPHFVELDSIEDTRESLEDALSDYIEDITDLSAEDIPMTTLYNQRTGKQRTIMSENSLANRYDFVDTQGSRSWGFKLEDQFQKQVVHKDGSMDGEYGWDTPGGGQVHVKYTAGKNGFRVVSSFGVHPEYDDDVKELREEHFNAHKNTGYSVSVSGGFEDDDSFPVNIPGVGVPLPNTPSATGTVGGTQPPFNPSSGVPLPSFPTSGDTSLSGSTDPSFNPNIGVPMPTGQPQGEANLGAGFNGPIGVPIPTLTGTGSNLNPSIDASNPQPNQPIIDTPQRENSPINFGNQPVDPLPTDFGNIPIDNAPTGFGNQPIDPISINSENPTNFDNNPGNIGVSLPHPSNIAPLNPNQPTNFENIPGNIGVSLPQPSNLPPLNPDHPNTFDTNNVNTLPGNIGVSIPQNNQGLGIGAGLPGNTNSIDTTIPFDETALNNQLFNPNTPGQQPNSPGTSFSIVPDDANLAFLPGGNPPTINQGEQNPNFNIDNVFNSPDVSSIDSLFGTPNAQANLGNPTNDATNLLSGPPPSFDQTGPIDSVFPAVR